MLERMYMQKYKKGVFLSEKKGRFLCEVLIDGKKEECYVSSSSRLSNYLTFDKNTVWLTENKGKRTKYTLEAVDLKNNICYLNFNNCNALYEQYLIGKGINKMDIHREYRFQNDLKVDIYIPDNYCCEIKGVLSNSKSILFPDDSSNRVAGQIEKYIELLKLGYKVKFIFFVMSPSIVKIRWNPKKSKLKQKFYEAIELGMIIETFSIVYIKGEFAIQENKKINEGIFEDINE